MMQSLHRPIKRVLSQNARRNLKDRLHNEGRPSTQSTESASSKLNSYEKAGFISVGELPPEMSVEEALRAKYQELEEREEKMGEKLESMSPEELATEYKTRVSKRIDLKLMTTCDADPMRLGKPGYEQRYYTEIGAAKYSKASPRRPPSHSDLLAEEEASRRSLEMGKAYYQGLCWTFAYYTFGPTPVAATADSLLLKKAPGDRASGRKTGSGKKGSDDVSHAAWNWSYFSFLAPLNKDLTRDVLRGEGIRQAAMDLTQIGVMYWVYTKVYPMFLSRVQYL